jgi:hypothetical protein
MAHRSACRPRGSPTAGLYPPVAEAVLRSRDTEPPSADVGVPYEFCIPPAGGIICPISHHCESRTRAVAISHHQICSSPLAYGEGDEALSIYGSFINLAI